MLRPPSLAVLATWSLCAALPLLSGCASRPAPAGQLVHTVFFWLKPDAPPGTADRLLAFYRDEVPGLPGVLQVLPGTPLASDRDVVDDSFTLGVTTVFVDAAAERVWQDHPVHQRMITTFQPHVQKVAVYDTVVAEALRR